uniref:Peptidase_M14 domain-containing protein n=1 Tax=Rhodnius prolixus TaxID=13249 RepID=T1HCV3_RHOPR
MSGAKGGYGAYFCNRNILQEIRRRISVDFTNYLCYDQVVEYLNQLSDENSCELIVLGRSEEGREILGARIGSSDAKAAVIESGIHAREWIAPITALYIISQISKDPEMVDNVQWIIIPILNPDGYHYSWLDIKNILLFAANRSFSSLVVIYFTSSREFSCTDHCNEDYRGEEAWSEPESRSIKYLIRQLGPSCALYLSLHNFLQSIMYPWGYSKQPPEDAIDLIHLATEAQTAIRNKYGTRYRIGQSSYIDRLTPGCSIDWAKAEGKIKYCYSIELPGPTYRFEVPPNHIVKIASECYEAIKVFRQSMSYGKI